MIRYCLNKKIAVLILTIIMAIFFLNLTNCKEREDDIGVNLVFSYPVIHFLEGEITLFNLTDTIPIVYYNNCILYELPKTRNLDTDNKIQEDSTFYLYHRDSSYGILFKPNKNNFLYRLPVDSFLRERAFSEVDFNISHNDTLVEVIKNDYVELLKKYVPKNKSENHFDSLFFYYTNKLKSVDFSLSKKLDSLSSMKLFKVRLIYNERFSQQYMKMLPKKELFFEIYKMSEDSLKKYIQVINKYRNF